MTRTDPHTNYRRTPFALVALALLLTSVFVLACDAGVRRFPLAEPLTEDPDRNHVSERPEEYWSSFNWDGADQMVFLPLTRFFKVDPAGPSTNVNSMDEVPNSSWFTNRIGVVPFTLEDARIGACPENRIDTSGPWTVTDAKPNGANPGFLIRAADGRRYLLKFDGSAQPERATSADVFGSRLYHAIGFHAPCNFIVNFDPDILAMDPDAESENALGEDIPMTDTDVQTVLDAAVVLPDGRLRASASLFLDGRPVGPWRYQGYRSDDPNDVFRHDDRRELRGGRVLAAWVNHFDTREQNTLAIWVDDDGTNYVRHYYIDFGDGFGSRWDWDDLTRRLGYSYYFDWGHVLGDFLTLGLLSRPWDDVAVHPHGPIFDYFDAAHFDPAAWQPGYPNPAFGRMQPEDGAWMARRISYVTDDYLRAMLDEALMNNPDHDAYLFQTLVARRDRLLETYLQVRSPLSEFEVTGPDQGQLCFTDLAARTGVLDLRTVRYETVAYFGDFESPQWARFESNASLPVSDRHCVELVEGGLRPDRLDGTTPDAPERYLIVDLITYPEPGMLALPPARLHFYDTGTEGFVLVGVERPEDAEPPAS